MTRFAFIIGTFALFALATNNLVADFPAGIPWQRTFSEIEALDFREADLRLSYGSTPDQFIDLWFAETGLPAAPLVVLIHGGCWLAEYDMTHIRPLATALAKRGYAVWAIEYRRVGQTGGGWPGTFHDIATAMDRLASFRDPRVATGRTVVAGHSAGGHLALWAAGRSRLEEGRELYRADPFLPRAAIGLAAITDLEAYAKGDNSCQSVTPELMGGLPSERPERYREASPAVLGTDIPVVLLQGGADRIVPGDQAKALENARPVFIDEAGHFDLIHPGTPAFEVLIQLLQETIGQ